MINRHDVKMDDIQLVGRSTAFVSNFLIQTLSNVQKFLGFTPSFPLFTVQDILRN